MIGNQVAEDFANAAMAARKFDHAIRERRDPEVSIELSPHLRGALQLATEVRAPAFFVIEWLAREISFSEQLRRTQRIIDAFTGYRIRKAGSITQQSPVFSTSASRLPGAGRESGDAGGVAFRGFLEFVVT